MTSSIVFPGPKNCDRYPDLRLSGHAMRACIEEQRAQAPAIPECSD